MARGSPHGRSPWQPSAARGLLPLLAGCLLAACGMMSSIRPVGGQQVGGQKPAACSCGHLMLPSERSGQTCHLRNVWEKGEAFRSDGSLEDEQPRACGTAKCPSPPGGSGLELPCTFETLLMEAASSVPGPTPGSAPVSIRARYAPRFCSEESDIRRSYVSFTQKNLYNFGEFNTQAYLYDSPGVKRQFALVVLPDGCVQVTRPGEREQVYTVNGGMRCMEKSYLRGEAVCKLKQKKLPRATKTQKAAILVHNAYGKNKNNFQHFFMDHLGPLLAAEEQLRDESGVRFLVDINGRSREILTAIGFPMKKLIDFTAGTRYCAKRLMVSTVLPLDQTYWPQNNTYVKQVWLPEDFVLAGQWMVASYARLHGGGQPAKKKYILYASRSSPRGKPHLSATGQVSKRPSRNIENDEEVISFLKSFVRERPQLGLEVLVYYGGFTSIKDSIRMFQEARVVVGVHGANMANIAMAAPDKGTAVVEFVGVRHAKYEDFLSYFYFGRSSALDYYNVPKRCSNSKCDKMHVNTADIGIALQDVLEGPQQQCESAL